jgi:membrane-bound lytic murein transglycosylase B
VRAAGGRALPRGDTLGAVLLPDGAGGDAFLVYANFAAIRRYNPSDYYALVVGLLGDAVVA